MESLVFGLGVGPLGSFPRRRGDPGVVDVEFESDATRALRESAVAPRGKVPRVCPGLRGREGDGRVVETWDGHRWRERNPLEP